MGHYPLKIWNPIILFWASRAIHLYINPFSAITLGYAIGFVIEGTPSSPKASDLGPPFEVLWTIVEDPTLTLAPFVGTSETEEQETQASVTRVRNGRNTTPQRSRRQRQPLADPGKGDRSEEQYHSAIGGSFERTLGKADSRGGAGLGSRQKSERAHQKAASHSG
ncbi:hypothetical protein PIB30_066759 [Stylosanthes scabra]|uniref:Uncharacterized protein n=1 Tax=Stylosanthes scabra TaxID=79078 RepID=A0ABU6XNQ8_9FABA|nr:hypothetical protein [Stylosanthes scabra]